MSKNNNNNKKKKKMPTSISFFDQLSAEDQFLCLSNSQRYWSSLSHDQNVEYLSELHEMIRWKIRQSGGVITHEQAVRDFLNNDFPNVLEATAQEMEQACYIDVARDIRQRRWGLDTFALDIIDVKIQPRGVLEGAYTGAI